MPEMARNALLDRCIAGYMSQWLALVSCNDKRAEAHAFDARNSTVMLRLVRSDSKSRLIAKDKEILMARLKRGLVTNKPRVARGRPPYAAAYSTGLGRAFHGDSASILRDSALERFVGQIDLIFTSPPFPLNAKKKYGNEQGEEYISWLRQFSKLLSGLLSPTGSIVIELGNSWNKGSPTMSTLSTRALLEFQEASDLHLCQEFVWSNPAKLPTPAPWVTIQRNRVKDSFTKLWWMSPSEKPKADNRRVLQPYSASMKKLLTTKSYNSGMRPSEHRVGEKSFLRNNEGSIPGSVLTYPNTGSKDTYLQYCREKRLPYHPARMPIELAMFFINFLTDPGDIVLDPFSGSNTTGSAAETLGRQWIGVEANLDYLRGSVGRFPNCRLGPALPD
jgi:site-specific DNA-methyltransferase (cytosine-N4-specific)